MSRRLIILPAAAADLAEARDWYEKRRDGLGRELVVEVDATLEQVTDTPEARPAEYRLVRRAPVHRFPYVVYYRLVNETIEILAILHGKRNPRIWRSRA